MIECSKDFSITIPACVGLASDATWIYNPNGNPGQPPASANLTYNFEGYYGTWQSVRTTGSAGVVIEWRTDWTSVAGPTLRVRATIVGSVTRGPVGANIICRAIANGNQVTATQVCPPNLTTPVNLDVTATDATLGGPTHAFCNHQLPADNTYSLSGEVFVSCS